jgi:hypothetical protein
MTSSASLASRPALRGRFAFGLATLSLLAAGLLGGCATPPPGPAAVAAAPAASAPRPTPPATAPQPGQPQPFATVVRDARRIDGLFTLWQRDDKVWFELLPADFGKPFFFGPKLSQGIGESRLFGGNMQWQYGALGSAQVAEFRRLHNQVQLIARNARADAPAGSAGGRAVQAGFSPSLLGSSPVASQPHPDRKSVLVEANPLFLSDLLGMGIQLQRAYRQAYALDRANTAFTKVRGTPGELVLEVAAHFASANLATPQPGQPPGLSPTLPRTLPDARSLFFGLHYALSALPAQPMVPRRADPRVGHFNTVVLNFGDDQAPQPQQRYVNRWRLEKKDPAAALSEPVKPITFWLDRTVPPKYRDAISRGVLAWNAAFERIGFKDALVVKAQPDDAPFDTLDTGVASIRWLATAQAAYGASGPSQVDPRSGEILDADISMEGLQWRAIRAIRKDYIAGADTASWAALMQLPEAAPRGDFATRIAWPHATCEHGEQLADSLTYALDVMEARGDLDPGAPVPEAFVLDSIAMTTMHEVGHALGLRHNFRASRLYTLAQLADPAFVKANGLAASVMDYPPIHVAAPGAPMVPGFGAVLGPYDFWAIEYAYKPLPPAQEEAELQRIAARSTEPGLAFGTDEDAYGGVDPEALVHDLGPDPVAFASLRIDVARDLIRRQATRALPPDQDYSVLRRSVSYALREMATAGGILARQIGGLRTLRDFAGSGQDPLQPVEAERERRALDLLSRQFLAADAMVVPAALQRRLGPNFLARADAALTGDPVPPIDYSVSAAVLEMQRALLAQLLSDGVAQRLLDNAGRVLRPEDAFTLSELYDRLGRDLWTELDARQGDIGGPRRELQREHATKLAAALVRPAGQGRADARSLLRQQAQGLVARIDAAQRRPGLGAQALAHLADVSDLLRQALQARIARPA